MPSLFQERYVRIMLESSYGTAGSTFNSGTGIAGEVDDESVQFMFDLMTRGDMSRYGAAKSVTGKEYSEGGVNLVAQGDDFCGLLLFGAYGSLSSGGIDGYTFSGGASATDPDVHTMTEHKSNVLPSYTLEIGREDKEHTYTGMCLTRLSMSAAHGEYVMMSADFTGKAESSVTSLADVTFSGDGHNGLHFADAEITFFDGTNAATTNVVKSVSLEFNLNLDTDNACSLGDKTYVRQPAMQMRELTGTIEFSRPQFDNSTGTGANNTVPDYNDVAVTDGLLYDGTSSNPAIKLKFVDDAETDTFIQIEIRKVRWEAPTNNVSGRDSSTMTLGFVGLVDTADEIMSKVTLSIDNQGSAGAYDNP